MMSLNLSFLTPQKEDDTWLSVDGYEKQMGCLLSTKCLLYRRYSINTISLPMAASDFDP